MQKPFFEILMPSLKSATSLSHKPLKSRAPSKDCLLYAQWWLIELILLTCFTKTSGTQA